MKSIYDISILLVDDYEINLQVLSLSLKSLSLEGDKATNGQEAYEKYIKKPYDLILMDIMMPVLDGYETSLKIRNFELENKLEPCVIIAVSANREAYNTSELQVYGINDILPKPFTIKDLREKLSQYFS
ncbi:MAG: response regulator [Bacteroidales bacterium]|nr:response regulator [Bacteroidales bacterium]